MSLTTYYIVVRDIDANACRVIELRARSSAHAVERVENRVGYRALAVFTVSEWHQATRRLSEPYCIILNDEAAAP